MWRRTATRLRNRQRLESSSWPVFKFKQSRPGWPCVSLPNRRPGTSGSDLSGPVGNLTFPTEKKIEKFHVVSPGHWCQPCTTTRSSHAVAGPGGHLDFAVAQLGFEARLGSCNVATYSHPIEKLAAAGELARFKQWERVSLPNRRPGPSGVELKPFTQKRILKSCPKFKGNAD